MIKFNPLTGQLEQFGRSATAINVATAAARKALTSAQVRVGDIVREVGQSFSPGFVTFSGANEARVNDRFDEVDTESGRVRYRSQLDSAIKTVWNGSFWLIYDDDLAVGLYKDADEADVAHPGLVTNWASFDAGTDPAPTVSAYGETVEAAAPGGTYIAVDTSLLEEDAGWKLIGAADEADVLAGTPDRGAVTPSALSAFWAAIKAAVQTWAANQTWNGSANTMPNQTASGGAYVMTRDLVDGRGSYFIWCINQNPGAARADDTAWLLSPGGYNAASSGIPASIPSEMTKFRVRVSMGFTTNPSADVFPIYVRFISQNINNANTSETSHGTRVGQTVYPNTSGGLTGTLTDLEATASGYPNTFAFASDWVTIPSAWQTRAAAVGSYGFLGIYVGNKSGGSLTDQFSFNHSIFGQIEFRR